MPPMIKYARRSTDAPSRLSFRQSVWRSILFGCLVVSGVMLTLFLVYVVAHDDALLKTHTAQIFAINSKLDDQKLATQAADDRLDAKVSEMLDLLHHPK